MWYRVRKSWPDEKSQIGAYQVFENAVAKAVANPGYSVFDESGSVAYVPPVNNTVKTMEYMAKLKKKIGAHTKGSVVRCTRDRKKRWVMYDGTVITDKANIDLTKQIYDNTCKYPNDVAEAWVNQEGFKSATDWLFWCNKWGQRIYIFKRVNNWWTLQKVYKCGTGNIAYGDWSDQGVGFAWKIWDKKKQFQGPQGMQYWNMHYSSKHGNSIHRGPIGKPSTHGCISMANAAIQWVFNNLPLNTRVVVY